MTTFLGLCFILMVVVAPVLAMLHHREVISGRVAGGILGFIGITAALMAVGFMAIISAAFSDYQFYVGIFLIGFPLLWVIIFLHLFRLVQAKIMRWVWRIFLCMSVAASIPYVFDKLTSLLASIPHAFSKWTSWEVDQVSETEVDLSFYHPYSGYFWGARLDSTTELRIHGGNPWTDTVTNRRWYPDLPHLDGATALRPLYMAFVEATYPDNSYSLHDSEVRCSDTDGAYRRLIRGEADVIFVPEPTQQQRDAAARAGVEFRLTAIGREAFVFIVHRQNPVDNLTTEQLRDIYSGQTVRWRDVGGKDKVIRAYQRDENSGSQSAFLRFMTGMRVMQPPMEDVPTGIDGVKSEVIDYTNYRNAIGFTFRWYVTGLNEKSDVKMLRVDGVYPENLFIQNGEYPLSAQFYAVTRADNDDPIVEDLLRWITGRQGQELVRKTGYCPLIPIKNHE